MKPEEPEETGVGPSWVGSLGLPEALLRWHQTQRQKAMSTPDAQAAISIARNSIRIAATTAGVATSRVGVWPVREAGLCRNAAYGEISLHFMWRFSAVCGDRTERKLGHQIR